MSDPQELHQLLEDVETLGIVCHDNPDPDCIASALALQAIARNTGLASATLLYSGDISHHQNRAFVNLLEVELTPLRDDELAEYDAIAFVDHALPGANSVVPAGTEVDIVVDHHPVPEDVEVTGRYVDVRPEYGATASILTEYLHEFGIEPETHLASGLLFALHRECLDYVRGPTVHEYDAARFLFPDIDSSLLDGLYGAAFTPATLDAMGEAIRTREMRGSALVSSTGRTTERDALPQAAEYLLNLEGISTVLVFGVIDDNIHLSARSVDPRVDVGKLLQEAYRDVGTAGGHHDKAGGRVPLGLFSDQADDDDDLDAFVSRRVSRRFFDSLGLLESEP